MKRNESICQAEGTGQGQVMMQQDRNCLGMSVSQGQELPGHVSNSGRLEEKGRGTEKDKDRKEQDQAKL